MGWSCGGLGTTPLAEPGVCSVLTAMLTQLGPWAIVAIVIAGASGLVWLGGQEDGRPLLQLRETAGWQWLAYLAVVIAVVPVLRVLNNALFLCVTLTSSTCGCFHCAFHMGALDGPLWLGALAGVHWAAWDLTINREIDGEAGAGTERLRDRIGTLIVLSALYRVAVGVLQRVVRGGVNVEGLAAKIERLMGSMKAVKRLTAAAANCTRERRKARAARRAGIGAVGTSLGSAASLPPETWNANRASSLMYGEGADSTLGYSESLAPGTHPASGKYGGGGVRGHRRIPSEWRQSAVSPPLVAGSEDGRVGRTATASGADGSAMGRGVASVTSGRASVPHGMVIGSSAVPRPLAMAPPLAVPAAGSMGAASSSSDVREAIHPSPRRNAPNQRNRAHMDADAHSDLPPEEGGDAPPPSVASVGATSSVQEVAPATARATSANTSVRSQWGQVEHQEPKSAPAASQRATGMTMGIDAPMPPPRPGSSLGAEAPAGALPGPPSAGTGHHRYVSGSGNTSVSQQFGTRDFTGHSAFAAGTPAPVGHSDHHDRPPSGLRIDSTHGEANRRQQHGNQYHGQQHQQRKVYHESQTGAFLPRRASGGISPGSTQAQLAGHDQQMSQIGSRGSTSIRQPAGMPSVDSLQLATQAAQTGDLQGVLRFVVVDPVVVQLTGDSLVEVTSSSQMRRLASAAFQRLDARRTGRVSEEVLRRLGGLEYAEAEECVQLMEATATKTFTRRDAVLFANRVWSEWRGLSLTMQGYSSANDAIRLIAEALFVVALVISALVVFGADVGQVLLTFGTVLVSTSFAAGEPIRNVLQSLIFIIGYQAFDVGDRVVIEGQPTSYVHAIGLLTCTFRTLTSKKYMIATHRLIDMTI